MVNQYTKRDQFPLFRGGISTEAGYLAHGSGFGIRAAFDIREALFHRAVHAYDGQRVAKCLEPRLFCCVRQQFHDGLGGDRIMSRQARSVVDVKSFWIASCLFQERRDRLRAGFETALPFDFQAKFLEQHLGDQIVTLFVECLDDFP